MSRSPRALPLVLATVLGLAGARDSAAQNTPLPYQGTPAELEALRLYNDNRLLTARTRAEEVLRVDPDSIAANYVLGCVFREAEGSLGRAMNHLAHAREVYSARYGESARPPGAPWQLHRDLLSKLAQVAGELEDHEYQLHMLEFYDSLYEPDQIAEHAWPLLHLGRYREARDWARRGMALRDPWEQSLGRNALCAIEAAAHQRQESARACREAFEAAQARARGSTDANPATAPHVAVHAYNASLAAASTLRFDEVERLALEGTHRLEYTTANPWRALTRLYTDQGRMMQAVNALREMQRWRVRQPANLRDQDRAETDAAVATVLLVAGEADDGMHFINRAIDRPDRRGLVASDEEQALGAHALLRRSLARTRAELLAERASWGGTRDRAGALAESALGRLSAWPDDERVANTLTDEARLDATLRFYVRGGIEPVPSWLVGDLVQVLGAGVVAVALRDVRREERANANMTPYYDGLEAEVALAQGDEDRALTLARRAMDRLPQGEVLLRGRLAAVGALAARAQGDERVELGLLEQVMQRDPSALRRFRLALPTVFRSTGTGSALERSLTLLGRSPRMSEAGRGFVVTVTGNDLALEACLTSPLGTRLGCARVTRARVTTNPDGSRRAPPTDEEPEATASRLAEEFHRTAFATRVGLSTQDLRSLDGSTVADTAAAREQMNNALRDITANPDGTP
ncbi:MAG: hypothetical protein HY909_01365 [Deltaproteobacteria bacterium]|nr:hypothetical protein [Deltaproteobacteria bacterium]